MIDWRNELRPSVIGLAVEGKDDKTILEAFLNGGVKAGLWGDWTTRLRIIPAESAEKVLNELRELPKTDILDTFTIYGLIDRDWRSEAEIADLQRELPQLLILPRIMIDNYLVNPDDLAALISPVVMSRVGLKTFRGEIDRERARWVQHGGLSKVLYENGAHRFCRGNTGYPRALLDTPITDEAQIERILKGWLTQLDPTVVLNQYRTQSASFHTYSAANQYQHCLEGKAFFNQAIIPILNRFFGQRSRADWLDELLQDPQTCPPDLADLLRPLVDRG